MSTQACGKDSNCINRTLSIECNHDDCPVRDQCQNQRYNLVVLIEFLRFRKKQYADLAVIGTPGKGHGLCANVDIEPYQLYS